MRIVYVCVCCVCTYAYNIDCIIVIMETLIPTPTTLTSIVGPPVQAWGHINHHLCIKRPKLVQS